MAITLNPASVTPVSGTGALTTSLERLSSGSAINSAADDAAGLAIATGLSSQIDGFDTAIRNASDAISLTQVADGALAGATDNLLRIRELTLRAGNGVLGANERSAIQAEIDQLSEATQQALASANFNGIDLFGGQSLSFQVGPNVGDTARIDTADLPEALTSTGFANLDITNGNIDDALTTIDASIDAVNAQAAAFGAFANRFDAIVDNLQTAAVASAEARSRLADTDFAEATTQLAADQLRLQVEVAVRAQANAQSQVVLGLLS